MQPDLSRALDFCQEEAFAAEQHIFCAFYPFEFKADSRAQNGKVRAVNHLDFARCQFIFLQSTVDLQKYCSRASESLHNKAHAAESRAKSDYNRNALAVSVFKRSGEILEWGCKWGSKALDIFRELRDSLGGNLSGRFPYKLAELLQPYGDITKDMKMKEVVLHEFEHAWERSTQKTMSADLADAVSKYLGDVFGENGKPKDFLDLFLCETFIDRPREGEE